MLQKQSEDIATEKRKTMESLKEELGLKVLKEEEKELDRLQTTTSGLLNEMNILKSEATIKKSELDLATKDLNRREEELVQMKVDLDNLKKNIQLREEDTMYLKQKLKELAEEDESADLQRKFAEDSAILQTSIQAQKKEHATLRLEIKHLRIAQEKRELIENGDELQAKIEKTEKEILAMENTLRLLNCTNENYKSNLETIELHGKPSHSVAIWKLLKQILAVNTKKGYFIIEIGSLNLQSSRNRQQALSHISQLFRRNQKRSLYSLGSDRDVDQFKGSDISISPSVVNLDPTLLIPGERKRAFQGYSSKFSK
ncbi:unnamed protein product [Nesidiocoris tenuis]|uniref:Uncharacterized protein n=1 Tax=Nesidiocoris tenuis TaxID=355587 RepID=A0A6H5HDL6_9HEMI|nr:unnamed protein product [Nesidiocoris tenuis]